MKKIYFFLIILFFANSVKAQYQFEGGVFVGMATYQGDFVKENFPLFKEGNIAFGLMGRYVHSYTLALRGNLVFGKISGNDYNYIDRRDRGFQFSTSITELSAMIEWEPLGARRYLSGIGFKQIFSPYLLVGAGLAITNPRTDYSRYEGGSDVKMEMDRNAKYLKTRFTLPVGLGFKFDFTENWVASFEIGVRYAFTDYLDGLSAAGNPNANDWYHFSGVSLFYRIPGTEKE
ncbi:MAG: hypothetical protein DHS20C18_03410 [Saprospiraceae bacterium]|nr:MAG: hypothetical protein DHS20C18_03410 [Saprospiraceae bacterium]